MTRIPHSRPLLGEDDAAAVASVVTSGRVAQGPEVARFEAGVAAFVGRAGGVAVTSGTAALEVALGALGVGPGDEVIVPSLVCASLVTATWSVGATPVVADVDPHTYQLSVADAAQRRTARTRAIVAPHLFGHPADVPALAEIGAPVIEDLAMALGARVGDRNAGAVGVVAVCSFYATKLLTTGEGGMVLADDPTLLRAARELRSVDDHDDLRLRHNHKLTDFQAALGSSQLGKLPGFLARRRALAERYHDALGPLAPVNPTGSVWYRYVLGLDGDVDAFIAELDARGIDARRPVFRPIHRYLGLEGYPGAEAAFRGAVSIPLYPGLTEPEVERIVDALHQVVPRYRG